MASVSKNGNGAGPAGGDSRRLPEGLEGLLLVGKLRHVAQSSRSDKQLLIDVETVEVDGHVSIQSVTGWMMEAGADAGFTTLGNLFAGGHLARLVGGEVCVAVSVRGAVSKQGGARVYITAEGIWPLTDSSESADVSDAVA